MARQYLRDVLLKTPAGSWSELRIQFQVDKTTSGIPNKAVIKVWNLSDSSRNQLREEKGKVTLESGYVLAGNRGIIFSGFIRDVVHERQDVDIITTLECGDGDKAHRESFVAETYDENTPIKDIILDIHSKMDEVDLGELKGLDDLPPHPRPMTFITSPYEALNELARTHNLYWSVQNGALEIIPADGALSQVTLISPQTGMIGTPSITDSGIIVKALLNPDIRPNRQIDVQSETTDFSGDSGLYRVSSVGYSGDNKDGEHIVEIEAEQLKGGKTKAL